MIGSHIIPRYYLEQFATKKKPSAKTGQFWVYAKGSEPRLGTPKSEGVENGYFGLPGEIEMENEANDLLVMAGNQTFVWSIFYRQKMANYVALLYARTKARRDASALVSDRTSNDLPRLIADDALMSQIAQNLADIIGQPVAVDLVKQSLVRTAETFKDGEHQRIAFLGEIFQNTEVVANILLQKNWQVWAAPNGIEFVTSDNPLVTMWHKYGPRRVRKTAVGIRLKQRGRATTSCFQPKQRQKSSIQHSDWQSAKPTPGLSVRLFCDGKTSQAVSHFPAGLMSGRGMKRALLMLLILPSGHDLRAKGRD